MDSGPTSKRAVITWGQTECCVWEEELPEKWEGHEGRAWYLPNQEYPCVTAGLEMSGSRSG